MKKLFSIGLAAAMMFAMAGQASATPLETSGEFRARYWMLGNYVESGKNMEFWDSRLRLTMVWPVSDTVKVTVRGDINEGFWGDNLLKGTTDKDVTTYGSVSNNASATRPAIAFDQVNLSFVWPNTPITIIVGRQTTTWGPGLFVAADNRDRFRLAAKLDATNIFYTYDKYTEVTTLHDTADLDDFGQHTIGFTTVAAGWNMGAILAYITNGTALNVQSTYYVVDAYATGKAGPVDIKTEFVFGTGKDDYKIKEDVDAGALAFYVSAAMPAGPVLLNLEGVYVAGDDPTTKNKNEGRFSADYQSPFNSVILFNSMDYNGYQNESTTVNTGLGTSGDGGISNAWGTKLTATMTPMAGLSLTGAVLYAVRLQDTAKHEAAALGTEIDLIANYAITPNVSWMVGGGFLAAGEFYGEVDDPWGLVSAFTVKF